MKFDVLLIDTPWKMKSWGTPHPDHHRLPPYPTMEDADLLRLPIGDYAKSNSVMFMWALDHKLDFAIELGEAWGFRYNTVGFYWLKRSALGGCWNMGTGLTTRAGSVEQCLQFIRGNGLPRINKGVRRLYDDIIFYPEIVIHPVMDHSRKPDEIRHRIEKLYGDVSRVELFARQFAPGWTAIGDAIDGKDIRDALREIANA